MSTLISTYAAQIILVEKPELTGMILNLKQTNNTAINALCLDQTLGMLKHNSREF